MTAKIPEALAVLGTLMDFAEDQGRLTLSQVKARDAFAELYARTSTYIRDEPTPDGYDRVQKALATVEKLPS